MVPAGRNRWAGCNHRVGRRVLFGIGAAGHRSYSDGRRSPTRGTTDGPAGLHCRDSCPPTSVKTTPHYPDRDALQARAEVNAVRVLVGVGALVLAGVVVGEVTVGVDSEEFAYGFGAGSKLHVRSEAQGLPLAVAVSGANLHDSQAFQPLILGIPAVRSRRGPRRRKPVVKIRADKAYHSAEHLRWLRSRNLAPRITRPGIESGERLGRHRWKIERSISWLLRLPPPHRPVRTKRQPLPRLPRPRCSPNLLQETREAHHVRHPLSYLTRHFQAAQI
ncbi:transposase [Streptomyces sp. NBC_00102]|uniref:transposase n=1 Tax=Streptomyces sp. NBC_00102 TaxID=2975652 RepID=UPI00338FE713